MSLCLCHHFLYGAPAGNLKYLISLEYGHVCFLGQGCWFCLGGAFGEGVVESYFTHAAAVIACQTFLFFFLPHAKEMKVFIFGPTSMNRRNPSCKYGWTFKNYILIF